MVKDPTTILHLRNTHKTSYNILTKFHGPCYVTLDILVICAAPEGKPYKHDKQPEILKTQHLQLELWAPFPSSLFLQAELTLWYQFGKDAYVKC